MPSFTIHSQPISKNFRAHLCSMAVCFQIFITGLMVIPPIFVAFRSQGFWLKEATYREQPEVQFKHDFILLMQGSQLDSVVGYSTMQNYNLLIGDRVRIPNIQSQEIDSNEDGRNDMLDIMLEVPLKPTDQVNSVQLLLFFDYRLHKFCSLQMESMGYLSHTSATQGSGLQAVTSLRFQQNFPLPHKGTYDQYNTAVVDATSLNVDTYRLTSIFSAYQSRNVSTNLINQYPVWESGRSASTPFTLKLKVNYPEQLITYRPGFWQLIKFAWIQYLAILVIFVFVLGNVRRFVFKYQIVTTIPQPIKEFTK